MYIIYIYIHIYIIYVYLQDRKNYILYIKCNVPLPALSNIYIIYVYISTSISIYIGVFLMNVQLFLLLFYAHYKYFTQQNKKWDDIERADKLCLNGGEKYFITVTKFGATWADEKINF